MVIEMKKIFVVDDDSSIGDILSSMLGFEGYDVDVFSTGKDGIKKAKEKKADLVLLDYFLPGERTEDLIKDFRSSIGEKLPIILMSASVQGEQRSKNLPINEFIAKPFQREGLLDIIGRNIN